MKYPQVQRTAPTVARVEPAEAKPEPTTNHAVMWLTERRQGERGPEWRSTITTIGKDGTTVRDASEWRSRRHWLLDYALQERTWKRWHIGDVARQVFRR